MKTQFRKLFLVFTGFFFISTLVNAQDIIYKKDQQNIRAKKIVIGEKEIEYVRFDDESGVTRTIPVSAVEKIKYADGHEKIIKQTNEKEVTIDKSQLWTDNTSNAVEPKERKPKIEKFIFSFGPRLESLICESVNLPDKLHGYGGGIGLSFPLGTGEKTDGKSLLSLTTKINVIYGRDEFEDYPDTMIPDQIYYTYESDEIFDVQMHITVDWRYKLLKNAFIAPSLGAAIHLINTTNYATTTSIGTNGYDGDDWTDHSDTDFKVGIVIGLEVVFSPVGFEVKYDQYNESALLGFNFAF